MNQSLQSAIRLRPGTGSLAARTRAGSSTNISFVDKGSTLTSSEEVNSTPTSFSPRTPSFTVSSSNPRVSGTYSGANGDTTLTFTATNAVFRVGSKAVKFDIHDSEGNLVEKISINKVNRDVTLSNGLKVRLSAGNVLSGDSFDVNVTTQVGESVDASNPFNGVGGNSANLQDGEKVVNGSFQLNGTTVTVNRTDSILDVLARINSSVAGISAAFDSRTESVVLTRDEPGPASILLSGDTSGFLSATKLDDGSSTSGTYDERFRPIAEVSGLSAITNGDLFINGQQILVDAQIDTLEDVFDRIAAAGASINLDRTSGKASIRSIRPTAELTLQDGSSGLLSAIGLRDGTFQPKNTGKSRFADSSAVKGAVSGLARSLGSIFDASFSGRGKSEAVRLRDSLTKGFASVFEDVLGKTGDSTLRSGLGIDLVARAGGVRELVIDEGRLARSIREDPNKLAEFLGIGDAGGGLLAKFEQTLRSAGTRLGVFLDESDLAGLQLDVRA